MTGRRIRARYLRTTVITLAIIFVVAGALYGWSVWRNNADVAVADRASLQQSLTRSIDWLESNQDALVEKNNPVLWWMLHEAGVLTGNQRLRAMLQRYREKWLDPDPFALWRPMFEPDAYVGQPVVEEHPDAEPYQLLFVYGLSCDSKLGRSRVIRQQLRPQFCGHPLLNPRCATHQFVGVRLMQRNGCGDAAGLAQLAGFLQDRIEREVTWDPRVTDAYLQRVLMLLESGATDRVEPVWVARILDAQNADGGWGDLDPVLHLPGGKALGFGTAKIDVRPLKSNFHATAQGAWLMALLLNEASARSPAVE